MLPVESPPNEDELDLRAYLAVLRRRWKLVALVVVVTWRPLWGCPCARTRSAVKFAGLARPLKVIQVTSTSQGEGKPRRSPTSPWRSPRAVIGWPSCAATCTAPRCRIASGGPHPGLTDVLVGDATLAEPLRRYEANILILPAGSPPPNPSELLASNKAAAAIKALAEEFDVVLVDTPPVLPVPMPWWLGRFADATLVVVDSRSTARKAVRRTLQLLDQVNAPVLGVVFNGAPVGGSHGYGYTYEADSPRRSPRRMRRAAALAGDESGR